MASGPGNIHASTDELIEALLQNDASIRPFIDQWRGRASGATGTTGSTSGVSPSPPSTGGSGGSGGGAAPAVHVAPIITPMPGGGSGGGSTPGTPSGGGTGAGTPGGGQTPAAHVAPGAVSDPAGAVVGHAGPTPEMYNAFSGAGSTGGRMRQLGQMLLHPWDNRGTGEGFVDRLFAATDSDGNPRNLGRKIDQHGKVKEAFDYDDPAAGSRHFAQGSNAGVTANDGMRQTAAYAASMTSHGLGGLSGALLTPTVAPEAGLLTGAGGMMMQSGNALVAGAGAAVAAVGGIDAATSGLLHSKSMEYATLERARGQMAHLGMDTVGAEGQRGAGWEAFSQKVGLSTGYGEAERVHIANEAMQSANRRVTGRMLDHLGGEYGQFKSELRGVSRGSLNFLEGGHGVGGGARNGQEGFEATSRAIQLSGQAQGMSGGGISSMIQRIAAAVEGFKDRGMTVDTKSLTDLSVKLTATGLAAAGGRADDAFLQGARGAAVAANMQAFAADSAGMAGNKGAMQSWARGALLHDAVNYVNAHPGEYASDMDQATRVRTRSEDAAGRGLTLGTLTRGKSENEQRNILYGQMSQQEANAVAKGLQSKDSSMYEVALGGFGGASAIAQFATGMQGSAKVDDGKAQTLNIEKALGELNKILLVLDASTREQITLLRNMQKSTGRAMGAGALLTSASSTMEERSVAAGDRPTSNKGIFDQPFLWFNR